MPGIVCKVIGCPNNRSSTKDKGITFHRFPKNPFIRDTWVQKCNKNDEFNPDNSHICSLHFKDEDYERDLKSELLGTKSRKKLVAEAIPSINLPEDTKLSDVTEVIFEIAELESNGNVEENMEDQDLEQTNTDFPLETENNSKYSEELNALRSNIAQLKKKNLALALKYKNIEKNYFEQIMLLKKRRTYLRKQENE